MRWLAVLPVLLLATPAAADDAVEAAESTDTPEPELPAEPRPRRGAVGVDGGLSVAAPEREGPAARGIGILAAEYFLPVGFFVGGQIEARGAREPSTLLTTVAIGGGARFGWLGGGATFRIGPVVGANLLWLRASLPGAAPLTADHLQVRFPVGVSIRLHLTDVVWLNTRANVELMPRRTLVRRRSDGAVLFDSGPLDASVLIGLRVLL